MFLFNLWEMLKSAFSKDKRIEIEILCWKVIKSGQVDL